MNIMHISKRIFRDAMCIRKIFVSLENIPTNMRLSNLYYYIAWLKEKFYFMIKGNIQKKT